MNVSEAKQILIACRPGSEEIRSREAAEALALVQREPELRQWWEQQQAFHEEAQQTFRGVPVPPHLREHLLARVKTLEWPWWRRPAVWAAAAAVLLLLSVIAIWRPSAPEDSFATFRSRVVRTVLRQYRMDIRTNDMAQIRQFLAAQQAPADYTLPSGLARLPAMGAGVLSWQDHKVSMVCLDAGAQGPLFLFVVDRASIKGAPERREFVAVKDLNTLSWTEGSNTYVLAGQGNEEELQQLL